MADKNEPPETSNASGNNSLSSENENEMSFDSSSLNVQESRPHGERHKFWETQPVIQYKDYLDTSLSEGPIEQPTPLSEVKQEPYNLPTPYEWITCDMDSEEMCNEVYNFLTQNNVVDVENKFRFKYSKEFLKWMLCPPGYYKSWHIGVRAKSSKKLVAFITGIPAKIRVRDTARIMAEVNFLCVHKKLRSKGLAPVMIKEVTRRIHLENIWQAAYAAAVVLPTSITTCQYWHRPLNRKNFDVDESSSMGHRMRMSRMIKSNKLPEKTTTPGFRKMEPHDVPAVTRLLRNYLKEFVVARDFDQLDVEHWLLPRENLVHSYLVSNPDSHEITDFCSFYTMTSSIHGSQNLTFSGYNVSTKTPIIRLMNDVLNVAKKEKIDVFNALDVMHNEDFLEELEFVKGDVKLHYYLYNYRLKHVLLPSELGLVFL